jgi:cyclophilin family peptidyl-prolyl cis-trans isomerase
MVSLLITALLATAPQTLEPTEPKATNPTVTLETTKGTIVIELDPARAPKTVANFLHYAESGFYEGTIFHRVIPGFMAQGGGFTADLQQKPTVAPVENEAGNGVSNARGTIAMARTSDPNSATAQFFINVVDNRMLDRNNPQGDGYGYAVFGRVTAGMEVVDAIVAVPRGRAGRFPSDVPKEPIVIQKVTVKK